MGYKARDWKSKLDELERRVTSVQNVSQQDVNKWAAECVAAFSILGVNADIIRGFMNMFENSAINIHDKWQEIYKCWEHPSRCQDRIKQFFYPNIAFTTARTFIDKIEEAERLVPQSLIDLLKPHSQYIHLATSLESMESSYQSKDVENLLASTGGLLGSILNLDQTVLSLNKLKAQIKFLLDKKNKAILDNFGVDTELMEIFFIFKYLRDKVSQHKKKNTIKPPFSVGYGFASLVLLLLIRVIDKGNLIRV